MREPRLPASALALEAAKSSLSPLQQLLAGLSATVGQSPPQTGLLFNMQKRPIVDPLKALDRAFQEIRSEEEADESGARALSAPLEVLRALPDNAEMLSIRSTPAATSAEPERSSAERSAPLPRDPLKALRILEKAISEPSVAELSLARGDDKVSHRVDPLEILRGLERTESEIAAQPPDLSSESDGDPDPPPAQ
jgi:hypothetical protein